MKRRELNEIITQVIKPIRQRVMMTIARALIESIQDTSDIQVAKVSLLKDEIREMERMQNFGFTSNPPPESEAICIFVQGNREHGIVISTENRSKRLKNLAQGEAAIYRDENHKIHLIDGGKFLIQNSQAELIDLLSQTLQALSVEPQIINKGTFSAIKTLLDTMKV